MMALDISLPFPGLFSAWAGSAKRYWVTLAKRRRNVPPSEVRTGFRFKRQRYLESAKELTGDASVQQRLPLAEGQFIDSGGGDALGRCIVRQSPARQGVELIVEEVTVPLVCSRVTEVHRESLRHPALEDGLEGMALRFADRIQNLVESIHLGERAQQLRFSD